MTKAAFGSSYDSWKIDEFFRGTPFRIRLNVFCIWKKMSTFFRLLDLIKAFVKVYILNA